MPTPRRRLGDLGERLAQRHLLAEGYRICEKNFRTRWGEVDIIAERDGVLVFVEVRTRRGGQRGTAAESLTAAKKRRLVALAEAYGQGREGLPEGRRIDVIAVDLTAGGRLLSLQHIEGAVEAE
jgi:putative endonuclease